MKNIAKKVLIFPYNYRKKDRYQMVSVLFKLLKYKVECVLPCPGNLINII